MNIRSYLSERKHKISDYLDSYIQKIENDPILQKKGHSNVLPLLGDFSKAGKMIRGGLVSLGYQLFQQNESLDLITTGAAMELMQSALLIHDDIMDQDEFRRGKTTLYKHYANKVAKDKGRNPNHTGLSLAICAGDLAFFLGFDLLYKLETSPEKLRALGKLFSREMMIVGTAQMDDVNWGSALNPPEKEDVINLYRHKTGRYTFSLPLVAGAILADQSDEIQKILMDLGENLGILFQIRDDELGLLGTKKETGKPVGSDIREGKKTLHYFKLMEECNRQDRVKLQQIFGNPKASEKEISLIQEMCISLKIPEKIKKDFSPIAKKAEDQINSIPRKNNYYDLLKELYHYNSQRNH